MEAGVLSIAFKILISSDSLIFFM